MALYTVQIASVISPNDVNQFTNLLNGTTTGVQITNSGRIRAQLTGATAGAGGYVGQINGGPPTGGTFVAGDFMIDGTLGVVWTCLAGGSPGNWVPAGSALVASQTLGSNAASVTFSSIPAFNNISVLWKARSSGAVAAEQMYLRLNGDAAAHYLWQTNEANATNAVSGTRAGALTNQIQIATITGASAAASTWFASGEFRIPFWNDTTNFAVAQGEGTAFITTTNSYAGVYGGQYNVAATLTSITLFAATGNLVTGSKFSLYGWM